MLYVIFAASFLRVYQFEKPLSLKILSCSSVGVRVSSARTRTRYVPSPETVTTSEVAPIRRLEDGLCRAGRRAGRAIQPMSPPLARARPVRVVAGEVGEVGAAVGLLLELGRPECASVGRAMLDLDHVPAERALDRLEEVAGLRIGDQDRLLEGRVDALSRRSTAACRPAGEVLALRLVALLAGDRVELAGVRLELGVGAAAAPGPRPLPTTGPGRGARRRPDGSSLGGVQDVADLDRGRWAGGGARAPGGRSPGRGAGPPAFERSATTFSSSLSRITSPLTAPGNRPVERPWPRRAGWRRCRRPGSSRSGSPGRSGRHRPALETRPSGVHGRL